MLIFGIFAVKERWNKIPLERRSIVTKQISSITEYKLQLALRQVGLTSECSLYRHVSCLFIICPSAIYM